MAREWDGNGWTGKREKPNGKACSCVVVTAQISGLCPDCGGEVPYV